MTQQDEKFLSSFENVICWEIKVDISTMVHKFWLGAWFVKLQTDKTILTYIIKTNVQNS